MPKITTIEDAELRRRPWSTSTGIIVGCRAVKRRHDLTSADAEAIQTALLTPVHPDRSRIARLRRLAGYLIRRHRLFHLTNKDHP